MSFFDWERWFTAKYTEYAGLSATEMYVAKWVLSAEDEPSVYHRFLLNGSSGFWNFEQKDDDTKLFAAGIPIEFREKLPKGRWLVVLKPVETPKPEPPKPIDPTKFPARIKKLLTLGRNAA